MISPGSAPSPDALYESADRGAKQISATGASLADWTPSSWRAREALQQPNYEDEEELSNALAEIANRSGAPRGLTLFSLYLGVLALAEVVSWSGAPRRLTLFFQHLDVLALAEVVNRSGGLTLFSLYLGVLALAEVVNRSGALRTSPCLCT